VLFRFAGYFRFRGSTLMTSIAHAELLLALVRRDWDAAEALHANGPVDAGFAEACAECDIHPQIHALLEKHGRLHLAGEAEQPLARCRAKVRHDNMLLIARTEQALDALLHRSVRPLALKGLDLIHRVYAFDERTLDDVDLLVPREQLGDALAALESVGWQVPPEPERTHYIRSSHHLPLDSPGPLSVGFELHWDLAQQSRFSVDVDGILERAVRIDIGGRSILRCDDHDLVAHLLLHHLSHYFGARLKWLMDMQQLTARKGFDWNRVVERIRRWGASVACGAALQHLHKLDPGLIPANVRRALPIPLSRRPFLAPLRSSHPLELWRGTRRRRVQLYLAAVLLERWSTLPGWLIHRSRRDKQQSDNPLDVD
jgi:hypothetical protein